MLRDKVLRMHFTDSILHFILRFPCCNSSSNRGLNHHLKKLPVKKKQPRKTVDIDAKRNKYHDGARK